MKIIDVKTRRQILEKLQGSIEPYFIDFFVQDRFFDMYLLDNLCVLEF